LSGRSFDLYCAHQAFATCVDGGYQPSLGVLGVPLIMVPDNWVDLLLLYLVLILILHLKYDHVLIMLLF
jgi:hypothetical protein